MVLERCDLVQQARHQFAAGTDLDAGDVVNRLIGIKRYALATGLGQRVNDVGADTQQAEFKGLKQTDRPCADDQGVDFEGFGGSGQGAGVWGRALRPARS